MFYLIISLFLVLSVLIIISYTVERSFVKEDLSYYDYIGKSATAIGLITDHDGFVETFGKNSKLLKCRTYSGTIPSGMTVLITGYDKIKKDYMVESAPPISP